VSAITTSDCPVCKSQLLLPLEQQPTRQVAFGCLRCGPYRVTFEALAALDELPAKHWTCRYVTSHAIRRRHNPDCPPFLVTTTWLASVWANENLPKPQEQADMFVEFIGTANHVPTDWVRCHLQHLKGLLGTADGPARQDGVMYIADHLKSKGLIEQQTPLPAEDGHPMLCRLTFDGWERFDELRRRSVDSRIGELWTNENPSFAGKHANFSNVFFQPNDHFVEMPAIARSRTAACKLVLHPEKTKIVYCKDANRRGDFPNQSFDFLGFMFRARKALGRGRQAFACLLPAASPKALTSISRTVRRCRLAVFQILAPHRRTPNNHDCPS
jgi:hypothetical protein